MALEERTTEDMIALIECLTDVAAARNCLREAYPELQFSLCTEDDIVEDLEPVGETAAFLLYLLDGLDHCLRLTSRREMATGIVLAEKLE